MDGLQLLDRASEEPERGRIGRLEAFVGVKEKDRVEAAFKEGTVLLAGLVQGGAGYLQCLRAFNHTLLERVIQLAQLLFDPAALDYFGKQGRLFLCSSANTATFERRMAGFTGLTR